MYKMMRIYCLILTVCWGLSAFGTAAEALREMPAASQYPITPQDPNDMAQEPNIPLDIVAEGVVDVNLPAPVLSVMTGATELPTFTYRLTYRTKELTDGDSWKLYQEFFASDPNHPERQPDAAFLRNQLALPLDKMDTEKVAAHLEHCTAKLDLLEQAVQCRTTTWPKIQTTTEIPPHRHAPRPSYSYDPPTGSEQPILKIKDIPALLKQLDTAGLLLTAKARYHLSRGEYDVACQWLQAALAQGRQMTVDTDAILAMAGAVNVGRVVEQIEAWVQQPQSPSLFRPLGDLPRPLIAFSNITQKERYSDENWQEPYDILEVEPEFLAQSPRIVQAIERMMAALQCIEAIRLHAALNDGRFPQSMTEITDVRVPLDPVTRQAFGYSLKDGTLTLSSEDISTGKPLEFHYRIIHTPQSDTPDMMGMGPMGF